MDKITPRLLNCFQTVFPGMPDATITAATQDSTPAWDSLATINLVAVIEDEFGLQMDYERIEKLNSFQLIDSYLKEKLLLS
jgi:acyl carrier protein